MPPSFLTGAPHPRARRTPSEIAHFRCTRPGLRVLYVRPGMHRLFILLSLVSFLVGCSSPSYRYKYQRGRTAVIRDGKAIPPTGAPPKVLAAIQAANEIAGLPYGYGRGHGTSRDTAYDCSGATSYVLRATGKLNGAMTSSGFRKYGNQGEGKWISVYARKGHVFLVIAGLRFDTGYNQAAKGPRWTTRSRPTKRTVIRHPPGL